MKDKKVIVLITSPPHGDIYSYEGIRAAAGISAGDLELEVFFIGKGVLNVLKNCEKENLLMLFGLLDDMEIKKHASLEDLEEMGINQSELMDNIILKKRKELAQKCHQADVTLNF